MDQFVWAPPLIAFYYVAMGVLEGPLALPDWLLGGAKGGGGKGGGGKDGGGKDCGGGGKATEESARQGWGEALSSGWDRAKEMTVPTLMVGMPFWAWQVFKSFALFP